MLFLFVFLNSCKRMLINAKSETSVSSQINNAGLKYFKTEAEQKVFCSSLKTSLAVKRNLNNSAFLLFMLSFSSSVNSTAILK